MSGKQGHANGIWPFFKFGFVGGGVAPVLLVLLIDKYTRCNLIPADYRQLFEGVAWPSFVAIAILIILSQRKMQAQREKAAKRLLYVGAVISILAMHFFVLSTGGSMYSIFTFYYLYMPTVAAIAFPTRKKKGVVVYACFSGISFYVNLFNEHLSRLLAVLGCSGERAASFYLDPSEKWSTFVASDEYRFAFLCVFVFQLVFAVTLDKRLEKPTSTPTTHA